MLRNNSIVFGQLPQQHNLNQHATSIMEFSCSYCAIKFTSAAALQSHCQSSSHQSVIMSDEGHIWKFRPPPRGLQSDHYKICENYQNIGYCRYGSQCVDAHGWEEFNEWKGRFEFRKLRIQRALETDLFGKSYTDNILEKWSSTRSPDSVMTEHLDFVEDSVKGDLKATVSSKNSQRDWTFSLKTRAQLKAVALLQDTYRSHFSIRQIGTCNSSTGFTSSWKITNDQEWISTTDQDETNSVPNALLEHRVRVMFKTNIYGTFRQSVVFDFGSEPVLVKHLCVDVVSLGEAEKTKVPQEEVYVSNEARWCGDNCEIIKFTSSFVNTVQNGTMVPCDFDKRLSLLEAYPTPRPDAFTLTESTVVEKAATKDNYRGRMHELLYVEEMARYEQVARYNVTTKLQIANCYLLAPNGMANSTAKYAHGGELFAMMNLGKEVSEDTSAGRLILNNCSTIFISSLPSENDQNEEIKRTVYEALIEDKGKNTIYLRLSATTVSAFNLKPDHLFSCQVQFQLNRIPYCEWHYAVDQISNYNLIFPETHLEPRIPWSPSRQWNCTIDSKLNLKQREAVIAITSPSAVPIPPILIIGPFGTGKTYTLAQAIKQLLEEPDNRVLVCSHSNSAADLYIKEYLDPWFEAGHKDAKPLRVYYHKRWVATVNQVVQKYCLIETANGYRYFKIPSLEDILKHKIVVITLNMSIYLSSLGLKKGHFTHILLDEAAQAMECEAIMPLALADDTTRIVLAGDHMQLAPELFSQFAKERNLHMSLLERLYDHYPANFPCKILLSENYRAHEAIINFTSELFYEQKLISSGKQPRHDKLYPLTFFTARGEDVQEQNSTAFYNASEVYELVERVGELRKKWPASWGRMDEHSIGIMTPYADQVFRIRSELRKRRMGGVSVERVLNVQGKQFRAIFLSTVRTRRTCRNESLNELDFGFLSNWKLLNTAITRAQSLVAVVGDPVALCSVGRCRKVWERFIEICNENQSLFGISWSDLRCQLDSVELKKTYSLNPLAPEFIPRALQSESYIRLPPIMENFVPPAVSCSVYYYPPLLSPKGPLIPVNRPSNIGLPYHIPNMWPPPFVHSDDLHYDGKLLGIPDAHFVDMKPLKDNLPTFDNSALPPNGITENFLRPIQISGIPLLRPDTANPMTTMQFLQNVHLPETPDRLPQLPQVGVNDWQLLLPPNTSLADVLSSKPLQLDWYRHLISTAGVDAANRFKDLVILASQKRTIQQQPTEMTMPSMQNQQQQPQPPHQVISSPFNKLPHQQLDFEKNLLHFNNNIQMQRPASQPSPSHLNDFHLNGREQDITESQGNKQNLEATYASVLRAQPARHKSMEEGKIMDPLGVLKSLARSSTTPGNNGLYQYFS